MSGDAPDWIVMAAPRGVVRRSHTRAALGAAAQEAADGGKRVVWVVSQEPHEEAAGRVAEELRGRGLEVETVEMPAPLPTGREAERAGAWEGRLLEVLPSAGQVVVLHVDRRAAAEAVEVAAARVAAVVGARRLELWSSSPGLFTADPEILPTARLLPVVGYDEAQEIVTSGPRVFHPGAVSPLRARGIPLHLRWVERPNVGGTRVAPEGAGAPPPVKAVSLRRGVTLVSLASSGMWRQVGFLGEVFGRFAAHGLSVNLVSTSETNVTVSLDPRDGDGLAEKPSGLEALLTDLGELGRIQLLGPCAALSLVGFPIRSALHRLGSVFHLFEDHKVHLLSLAEDDVNLTLVVEEDQGERLLHQMHELLLGNVRPGILGPTREELTSPRRPAPSPPRPWWWLRRDELLSLARSHAPAYVYSKEALAEAVAEIRSLSAADSVFYAVKACPFPEVLRHFHDSGLGFECVSPGEVLRIVEEFPAIDRRRILFTPNFAPRQEYAFGFEAGAWVTLDNLDPLRLWPELFAGRDLLVRLDPGRGGGHHPHVRTAGAQSKFGIPLFELDELSTLAGAVGARIVGLHAHVGSGLREPEGWGRLTRLLAETASGFPTVEILDAGGGLGVAERPGEAPLDLAAVDRALLAVREDHPRYRLWLEPGRFLVARAGVLLARVTQTKGKVGIRYVGVETGMNTLIRPALYGAYHEIVNLSRLEEPATELTDVVGPICESGDVLGSERLLPPCREDDVLLVANVGAYGAAMSSRYNLREPAVEMMI
jgi:bifunctional diaminopimelate decarboxylase / aspartate kinase